MDFKINNRLAFIQNRCQICLYERYNTLRHLQDFSWIHVSKIIYFTNDPHICSICFSESVLPRMDKCGHVFCLSCILNFLQVTNSERVLCPMCKDVQIDINSIKRVTFRHYNIVKVGEVVKFRLMVKGNDNICPRFADDLIDYSDHVLPRRSSSLGKYVGVVVEKDFDTFNSIKSDIAVLRKQKSSSSEKNFCQSMLHLTSELEHFQNEIRRIIDDTREETARQIDNNQDKFNLLEYEKMRNRFRLFYQSCGETSSSSSSSSSLSILHLNVYLDEEIEREILEGETEQEEGTDRTIPVALTGEITAVRTELLDLVQQNSISSKIDNKWNHLFQGAKIVYLRVNLRSSRSIDKCKLRLLRSHQEILFKAEKEEEELRKRVAQRAAESKHLKPPCRIVVTNGTNNQEDADNIKKKFANIVDGFNTCTLGIECLVPDDDYPHAEDCKYYCKDSVVSKENVTEEKYFGLLRFKLNVFRGDEEVSQSVEENFVKKNDMKNVVNYPPELINLNEVPTPLKSNFMSYIVPKKPNSQFQQKQMRKLKKSISKMSC